MLARAAWVHYHHRAGQPVAGGGMTGAPTMTDTLAPLVRDLVTWVAAGPRPYAEVIEAWRTSCPRLTVWEDAVEGGFVAVIGAGPDGLQVVATPRGQALLAGQ
jgi:hypothetical protein